MSVRILDGLHVELARSESPARASSIRLSVPPIGRSWCPGSPRGLFSPVGLRKEAAVGALLVALTAKWLFQFAGCSHLLRSALADLAAKQPR